MTDHFTPFPFIVQRPLSSFNISLAKYSCILQMDPCHIPLPTIDFTDSHNGAEPLVSSEKTGAIRRADLAMKRRARTSSGLDYFEPYPPVEATKEERAQATAALPDMPPDYKHIEKYNIVSVSGEGSCVLIVGRSKGGWGVVVFPV